MNNDLRRYNQARCYSNAPEADKVTIRAAQQGVNQPIDVPPGQTFIPL